MNLQFRKLLTAGLLALVAVSTPALSQDTGWYAGLNLGQSKVKDFCAGTTTCDDTDTAFSIFAGYQVNRNFGVEFGYVDLGNASGSIPGFSASFEASGFEVLGVGTIPINQQFAFYGKLGFFLWDLDVTGTISGLGSATLSEDGTDLTYAIGLRYSFTKNLAMQVQWQRYTDIGDAATTGKSDVDVIGVGVVFRF